MRMMRVLGLIVILFGCVTLTAKLTMSVVHTVKILPAQRSLWKDPDPAIYGERGETWRLTNAHNKFWHNLNYHRVSTPFSPDGRYIVFTGTHGNASGVYLVDFGNESKRYAMFTGGPPAPAPNCLWDRTGRRIYIQGWNKRVSDIYEVDISSLPTVVLTRLTAVGAAMDGTWALSPDGENIAFSLDGSGRGIDRIVSLPVNPLPRKQGLEPSLAGLDDLTVLQYFKPTINVKVNWVGNRYVVWGHKDPDCPLFSVKGHIHVLDIMKNHDDSGYDRVLTNGGHLTVHPDESHYICADRGYNLGGIRTKRYTWWGMYNVHTGKRNNLKTPLLDNGNHTNLSPDGTLLAVDTLEGDLQNWVSVLPLDGHSDPTPLVEHGMRPPGMDPSPWDLGESNHHVNVHWSPDSTKIAFRSNMAQDNLFAIHGDIYVVVYERPGAVTEVKEVRQGQDVKLGWRPASRHREIKHYRILLRTGGGSYEQHALVPQVSTIITGANHLSANATEIEVESTEGFPDSGLLELQPLLSVDPPEIVRYTGKDDKKFLNVQRGKEGSIMSSHYRGTRVWFYPLEAGYIDYNATADGQYAVQSEEWSGLRSELPE